MTDTDRADGPVTACGHAWCLAHRCIRDNDDQGDAADASPAHPSISRRSDRR